MPSIVTITFSPCIDKSCTVPQLIPERKLKCTSPLFEPGGGGINVARAIRNLGGVATAIYPSGGFTGRLFNLLMEKEGIQAAVINAKEETRENFIVVDEATQFQYRFGMPGNKLSEPEWRECIEVVEGMNEIDFLVASGSLPPGVPEDIYARLAKIARSKNAKFIVDSSGEALKRALEEGVFLIKPNLGELSALAGKGELDHDEIKEIAREIIERGKCEVVVVSLGAAGAMLVARGITETIAPPPVVKKSTVGAGDSMVAGIVLALSRGKTLHEAIRYGVACGTAATMNPGTELCRKADADNLYSLISG